MVVGELFGNEDFLSTLGWLLLLNTNDVEIFWGFGKMIGLTVNLFDLIESSLL